MANTSFAFVLSIRSPVPQAERLRPRSFSTYYLNSNIHSASIVDGHRRSHGSQASATSVHGRLRDFLVPIAADLRSKTRLLRSSTLVDRIRTSTRRSSSWLHEDLFRTLLHQLMTAQIRVARSRSLRTSTSRLEPERVIVMAASPAEHKTVQARILAYAEEIGWRTCRAPRPEAPRIRHSGFAAEQAQRRRPTSTTCSTRRSGLQPEVRRGPGRARRGHCAIFMPDIAGNRDFLAYLRNTPTFYDEAAGAS